MCTAEEREILLEVSGLTRSFGTRVAIGDLSLTLRPGDSIALAGPNGAGKSTALRLLAGLLSPDQGSGQALGRDLHRMDAGTRNRIGFLPQRSALYPRLSILENLRFRAAIAGMDNPMQQARAAAQTLGLDSRAREPLARFSGGWIRRIELAATLIHRPLLLLLDEPTTGLDEDARSAIWHTLNLHCQGGGALVFSSHDAVEIARAGKVLQLSAVAEHSP